LSRSFDNYAHRVLSGTEKGLPATTLRALTSLASPLYSTLMRARNLLYDAGLRIQRLPRPVISVGNLTTGGTGKTPVVQWLYHQLRHANHQPAILLRGYKSNSSHSDEETMLRQLLTSDDHSPIVHANPNRHAAGQQVLRDHTNVTAFLLDDGFQHRRLARDFDLVLIDAINPFGYDRVLPRGLLREPLTGLKRAHAILITRTDLATTHQLEAITHTIQRHNPQAPISRCAATHTALRTPAGDTLPLDHLTNKKFSAFAGIGNPQAFEQQLRQLPGHLTAPHWFPDHHAYSQHDLEQFIASARNAGAQLLITTEKDWVKISSLRTDLPIYRLDLLLRFEADHEHRLAAQILSRIQSPPP
jgi:tetraacyldisaccharide 4'-kinase